MKALFRAFGVDAPVMVTCLLGLVAVALSVMAPEPAAAQSANVYAYAQQAQTVQYGMVVDVREVTVATRQGGTQVGQVVGASLGGVIGAAMGQNAGYAGQAALGMVGAALGGLLGNNVAEKVGQERAIEIIVQVRGTYNPAQVIAVVQPFPGPNVQGGQPVAILSGNGQIRVIPMSPNMPQASYEQPAQAKASYQPQVNNAFLN